jgi:hypothetical protein
MVAVSGQSLDSSWGSAPERWPERPPMPIMIGRALRRWSRQAAYSASVTRTGVK